MSHPASGSHEKLPYMWCQEHPQHEVDIVLGVVDTFLRLVGEETCSSEHVPIGIARGRTINAAPQYVAQPAFDNARNNSAKMWYCPDNITVEAQWMVAVIQRCCLSPTSTVATLVYAKRLVACDAFRHTFHHTTWRNLFVALVVISEKYWEDNYVHPMHILNTFRVLNGQFPTKWQCRKVRRVI